MRANQVRGRWLAGLLVLGLSGAAAAAGLRLPPDHVLAQGEGSPGKVTFSHAMHVDDKAPGCVGCHPTRFAMLKAGTATGLPALSHAAMEKGQACGACHGKQAFGFESCEMCHK
jgi:c(7)-type cytochrome triheme protein